MFILSNYCICNGFLMFGFWSLRAKGLVFPVTSSPLRWRNELQKCCSPLDLGQVKYLADSAPGFSDTLTPSPLPHEYRQEQVGLQAQKNLRSLLYSCSLHSHTGTQS